MFTGTLISSLLLLPLVFSKVVELPAGRAAPTWNYNDTRWGNTYPECNGRRQSPINLVRNSLNELLYPVQAIKWTNYDDRFLGPLILTNTGKTVEINFPPTINGQRPSISGAKLDSNYELMSFHIHWGSLGYPGSEHTMNNKRHDGEFHMVHKNMKYATMDEAVKYKDGLAVLGVFLEIVEQPKYYYPGLLEVFNTMPYITHAQSSARVDGRITAAQFLGDTVKDNLFTYSGSLTTPLCAEVVTWHVFPKPLTISLEHMKNLWELRDDNNNYLLNNFRPIQAINGRQVLYKI